MQQLHGNWHVARAPLKVLPAQRQSAKDTAEKKKGKGPARAAVVAEIARLNSKGRKPKLSIPDIAAKADCTETYVRRIINGK